MTNIYKLTFLFIGFSLAACTSKKEKLTQKIYELEISDSSSTPNGMNNLATMYFDYATQFDKDSIAEKYMFKGFMFKYIIKHWDEAISYANYYKSNFPVSESYHMVNLKLADLYHTGKNNIDSAVHYYMICDGKVQFSTAEKRISASVLQKWVNANPNTPTSAHTLYTAAKLLQMANEYNASASLYNAVALKYPLFKKSPDALLAAGFIYWENLKNLKQAEMCYKQLAEKYPLHPLAKEAKTILSDNILAMSDLELADHLIKKNKAKIKTP